MPHVSFVPFTGLRIYKQELCDVGMTLPGLRDRAHAVSELPGLGLLTLAGMLPSNWTCSYHYHTTDFDKLIELVLRDRPALVAVSALTASVEDAYRFSSLVRSEGIPVVMGGLHVTVCPEEARRFCTAVVVGEGEATWLQVLSDVEKGELKSEYTSFNNPRDLTWPTPKFDLLVKTPPRFTLQTQRGCPLACEFCGASRLLGAFREKPTHLIRQELDAICALNSNPIVELADDNTFVGKRPLMEFFDVFADSGVRYFTETDWRIGTRPELLRNLAVSGCVQVLVGIESLIFRYPGMGQKADEFDRIIDAINAIQESGVAVNGCFIIGADGETHDSIDRLVQFILESPFADVQLTLQTPFPGTPLFNRLSQSQRIIGDRGWSHYTLFDVTFLPDKLSVEELEKAFKNALSQVYSSAATAKRRAIRKQIWKRNPRLQATEP